MIARDSTNPQKTIIITSRTKEKRIKATIIRKQKELDKKKSKRSPM
jgi:hypothetical protein